LSRREYERLKKDEKELLKKYRQLIQQNKDNALTSIGVILVTQENTKRQYNMGKEPPKPAA
jgi:hypothetical protein